MLSCLCFVHSMIDLCCSPSVFFSPSLFFNSFPPLTDDESNVDEDELHGLLGDANVQYASIDKTAPRKLRQKAKSSTTSDPSLTPQGEQDMSKKVCKVSRGFMIVGEIKTFIPVMKSTADAQGNFTSVPKVDLESSKWKVVYEDNEEVEVELDYNQLR